MPSLESILKQKSFDSEHVKSNVNVIYTSHWIYHRINLALKPFGLTHEQFNVLRILRGSFPNKLSQKVVKERMIAPNSNITLIIKRLTKKGFISVERSESDKREYQITISEAGLGVLSQLDNSFMKKLSYVNRLSQEEAFQLNALLDKLRGDD